MKRTKFKRMKRTKFKNVNQVLAVARPNMRYEYFNNFEGVTIEIRMINDQRRFYEMQDGREVKCLKIETVKSLFKVGGLIKSQPFLKKSNMEFYNILFRK